MIYVFPSLMMMLSLGASTCYAIDGDPRKTIYWLAAAVITAAMTF